MNIVRLEGKVIGVHDGIINYTIGQRKGIKIAEKDPLYVIKINAANNEIIVGSKENLAKRKIKLKNVNIITDNKKDFEKEIFVKVRSTGKLLRAKISLNSSEANVDLLEDEYGISPGQACVFYFKNNVLSEKGAEVFKNLLKDKINVVFSDALHSEEGIISEYENIVRNNLSNEFIYYFDDLNMNDVQSGVEKVFKDIKIKNEKARFYSFWTYGWIGQYEKLHKIGLITTLDINSLLKEKKLSLPLFKEVTNV